MRRSELEPTLKQIHRGLKVNRHSNRGEHIYHGGNDAVYFYSKFIGAVPPGNIYKYANQTYKNINNMTNRSLRGLADRLWEYGILRRYNDQATRKLLAG